jgi:hypothetical protein
LETTFGAVSMNISHQFVVYACRSSVRKRLANTSSSSVRDFCLINVYVYMLGINRCICHLQDLIQRPRHLAHMQERLSLNSGRRLADSLEYFHQCECDLM